MRTTISLDDQILRDAKELAARTERTLGRVIEDALREVLARSRQGSEHQRKFKFRTFGGRGLRPGVNLDSNAELLDLMEEGLPIDKRR